MYLLRTCVCLLFKLIYNLYVTLYMSGHAVCVSVSILVCAYGNCTQMSSWWWLNLEIDLNNLTFWQVPSTTCCWSPKFPGIPWNYPQTQQQSQPGISSIFSGESRTKPSFVTGILGVFVTWSLCQEMLCPKFPLTRKHLVDPWLKKFQELYCKRCSWATYFHQILQFCAWNCRWSFLPF